MDKAMVLRVQTALNDKLSGPLARIRDRAGSAGRDMTVLRNRLKGLNDAQRDVAGFRELSSGLRSSRGELAAAQQRVAQLATAFNAASAPTRKMSRELEAAKKAAGRLKQEVGEKAIALDRLRGRLSSAGISTNRLADGERGLRNRIAQTNTALNEQAQRLKSVAAAQQRAARARESYDKGKATTGAMAGAGVAGMAAGGGSLYAASRFISPGLDFDFSMSRVQALARLEKSDSAMGALREQARQLGATTMYTAGQAADAQGFLAMAGFKPDAILAAMPGMLSLAKAGNTELAATADIASNILTGFNLVPEKMGEVSDVLVATFTRSNVSMEMLGDTMKYVAPVAAGVGQSIETVAAMAGKLGDAGIQGSMGGTALRAVIGRLAAPPKMAADALKELGIQTTDVKGNLRDLPAILAELDAKTKKMGNAQRAGYFKHIAGEEAFSALQVLSQQAANGELQKLIKTLRSSAGEANKAAGVMGDNLRGDLDEMKSAWEDLGIEMEEANDGALRSITQGITGIIGRIKAWATANPALANALTRMVVVGAAVVAVLGTLTLAIASVLGPFLLLRLGMTMLGLKSFSLLGGLSKLARVGFGAVVRALAIVGRAFLMSPIGLIVTGIATSAYLLYQYWEPISAFFSGLWSDITSGFSAFAATTGAFLRSLDPMPFLTASWASLSAWFAGVWQEVGNTFDAFGARTGAFLRGLNPIPLLAASWESLSGWFGGVWGSVGATFDNGLEGVLAKVRGWSPLESLKQATKDALAALALTLPDGFSNLGSMMMTGLVNGITRMGSAVKESITSMGGSVVSWFKEKLGIHSPSRVMATMGEFVSEGAAVGIKNGEPDAVAAARALAAAVAMASALALPAVSKAAEVAAVIAPAPLQVAAKLVLAQDVIKSPAKAVQTSEKKAAPRKTAAKPLLQPLRPADNGPIRSVAAFYAPSTALTMYLADSSLGGAENGSGVGGFATTMARAGAVLGSVVRPLAGGVLTRLASSLWGLLANSKSRGSILARSAGVPPLANSLVRQAGQGAGEMPADGIPGGGFSGPPALRSSNDTAFTAPPPLRISDAAPLSARKPGQVVVHGDTITIQIPSGVGSSPGDVAREIETVLRRRDAEREARARSAYRDSN